MPTWKLQIQGKFVYVQAPSVTAAVTYSRRHMTGVSAEWSVDVLEMDRGPYTGKNPWAEYAETLTVSEMIETVTDDLKFCRFLKEHEYYGPEAA